MTRRRPLAPSPAGPPALGSLRWRAGRADLRIKVGSLGRKTIAFPTCRTEAAAEERRRLLAGLVDELVAAHVEALGWPLLELVATSEGEALHGAVEAVHLLARGEARQRPSGAMTLRELGEAWTSGELARRYPDHVRKKKSAKNDVDRLGRHVYPVAGDLPVAAFTPEQGLDHAERIMAQIPAERAPATRRHVAQALHKLLNLAVFPLRILTVNPLPKGWLPRLGPEKAKAYLYPDEEARLLALRTAPLAIRMFYGFLAREGMRSWSEAAGLEWSDLDLARGVVSLDKNKTDDPRAWALRPDVVRALRIWRKLCPAAELRVFGDVFEPRPAASFRERLQAAGIERAQLYENNADRLQIRVQDLRATFVTLALANGRTEAWIADRTGHRSSQMINRYKRAARTVAETGLGDLAPLDTAIPELAEAAGGGAGGSGGGGQSRRGDAKPATAGHAPRAGGGAPPSTADKAAPRGTTVDQGAETRPDKHAPIVTTGRNAAKRDETDWPQRPLNPLIVVRIHAREPGT